MRRKDRPQDDPFVNDYADEEQDTQKPEDDEPDPAERTSSKKRPQSDPSRSGPRGKTTVRLAPEPPAGKVARFHAVMQYLFLGLGVFFFICLFLNLICNFGNRLAEQPGRHWMGYVGYGISYALHGMLGVTALFLPIGMVTFFIFWKKLREERRLSFKLLNSVALLVLISTLIHTFYLAAGGIADSDGATLTSMGAQLVGGGFLGGKLAHLAIRLLNWAGAFVLEFILFFASFFYMLGMTPRYIITRWKHRRELSDKSKKTLSEQEAEQAKRRAKEAADEKRAQTGPVKTTPEGYPDGSVTVYKNGIVPSTTRESGLPPIPAATGADDSHLYLPAEIRRKMREEDERKRQQAAEEERKRREAEEEERRKREAAALPKTAGTSPVRPAPTPAPVSDEVRTSYESADPIFPQTDNKGTKRVRKDDRDFDLHDIFNDEDVDEPLAPPPPQHAPLPPEKPVPTRSAPKKAPPQPEEPVPSRTEPPKAAPVPPPAPPAPVEEPKKEYVFPPIDLLKLGEQMSEENRAEIEQNMRLLATTLEDFRVGIKGIDYACGPTVTRYEITPAPGVHARAIMNLASDIALAFAVSDVRMAQISGKSAIGVEVPNKTRHTVFLRNLLESDAFRKGKTKLTVALGADVVNDPVVFDITEMPHLLVGGATKMGKSVCINCTITSLLYQARPDEVKLILIDPKKVEFTPYKSIPHLLAPIITSANDAAGALQAAVAEMESRFELIQEVGAKNAEAYNEITKDDPDKPFMPYLVIIIDELADLMLQARDQVEEPICRLLQKGRASGIHLILGTQRPSVDVVTGLIKSNVPSRIACTVASQVDSRTILDGVGAEKLLGRGDMLFSPVGSTRPERVQGAFVSDKEVESVCNFIRAKNGNAVYDEKFTEKMKEFSAEISKAGNKADDVVVTEDAKDDPKYLEAVRVAMEEGKMSTSLLQRRLGLGYGRAAKLIDRMQAEGIVSPPDGSKPRTVLITADEFLERFANDEFGSVEDTEE